MDSLIKKEQANAQPTLFALDGSPHVADLQAAGHFSGEQLFRADREKYDTIVAALGEGMGIRQIARALKVSTNTVRAIRDRECELVDDGKRRTAQALRRFARMGAERLVEEIDEIPVDKLPLAVAIAVDKAQLLDGEATARIETVKSYDPGAWQELVQSLPEIPVQGTVIETGCDGDENGAKGAAPLNTCSDE